MRVATRFRARPRVALAVAVLSLAVAAPAGGDPGSRQEPRQLEPGEKPLPNIVVVMTDDQTAASFESEAMPRTFELIVEGGTLFEGFVASTPLCCPSRAGFLTGQYAHNNGVLFNVPGYGTLIDKHNVLPVWLRRIGYRTSFFGKFLLGYEDAVPEATRPAPGWGHWAGLLVPRRYYDYDLSIDGERTHFGRAPGAYLSTRLTELAVAHIDEYAPKRRPLFTMLGYLAPHSAKAPSSACHRSAIPAPGDEDLFAGDPLPLPASFNEADVSDKPSFVQRLTPIAPEETVEIERTYRCRLASLQAVDRGVEAIYGAFERAGEIDRTVFVFTGDNGYFQGEHRQRRGKALPYEESIRQPLAILVPRAYRGGTPQRPVVSEAVANIDLAPTILDLAQAVPCRPSGECRTLDGRSLMPLIEGSGRWPADRGVLVELDSPVRGSGRRGEGGTCEYAGIRTQTQILVEHTRVFDREAGVCTDAEEVEHYDLESDPFQLQNLFPPAPLSATAIEQAQLAARLRSLQRCAGTPGNEVPGKPPCE